MYLQPKVIGNPAHTAENEQAPLITAHADILDGSVDDLCFPCDVGSEI